MNKSVGK